MKRRTLGRWLIGLLLVGSFGFVSTVQADPDLSQLRRQARDHERSGDWARACAFYAYILTLDRDQPETRERFQTCLRHFHRVRRHQDPSYKNQVLKQSLEDALLFYSEVLKQIRTDYLAEKNAGFQKLYQNGVDEIRLSLADEKFRRDYLPKASNSAVAEIVKELRDWRNRSVETEKQAQRQAMKLARRLKQALQLNPTVAVVEMACGACNALDEHTYYLTPREVSGDYAALRGETVGIGVQLAFANEGVVVAQVIAGGPAAQAGIRAGDRIVTINDRPLPANVSVEQVTEKLNGKTGTTVRLEIRSGGQKRGLTLVRLPINTSVAEFRMLDMEAGVGYIHLVSFHQNTLNELNDAIGALENRGMKALILDLRGNAGGLFQAATQVAERFLYEGATIVGTQSKTRQVKYVSRNVNPLTLPVVVLVDGGTASAAEIVAGALKENGRATLVGQSTYGKGTVQHMIEWKSVQAGGIRITWAKFLSPLQNEFDGIGVAPDVVVPRTANFDHQLEEAENLAREKALMSR